MPGKKGRGRAAVPSPPAPPRPELSWEHCQQLYAAARKIANLVWAHQTSEIGGEMPWAEDWRWEEVNPFHHQTADGLFLEYYYGHPSTLWTPWGKWSFVGSGEALSTEVVEEIMSHLTTTLFKAETYSPDWGSFGPVYAVHAVDGDPLPEPIALPPSYMHPPRGQYIDYEVSKELWERLTQDWCATNGVVPPPPEDEDDD